MTSQAIFACIIVGTFAVFCLYTLVHVIRVANK